MTPTQQQRIAEIEGRLAKPLPLWAYESPMWFANDDLRFLLELVKERESLSYEKVEVACDDSATVSDRAERKARGGEEWRKQ